MVMIIAHQKIKNTNHMDKELLTRIYKKTDGYCHICHEKLSISNYGRSGCNGAWEIEHSKPKSKNGSNHLNNLFPACISCNREKGSKTAKSARAKYGNSRAPYSKEKKDRLKSQNTVTGAIVGGTVGALVAGPLGIAIGSLLGGNIGKNNSPKK
jgi:5-methylcytosine-specific restriction endonuclease McrA